MQEMTANRADEVREKLGRVRDFLERADLDGALFTTQGTVAWVTGGMEDLIVRGADPALVWALVRRDGAFLLTQNVEAPRIEAEEKPAEIGFELHTFPWEEDRFDGLVEELCASRRLANDGGGGPGRPMAKELQQLRLVLTGAERERMRALGADACESLEGAVRNVRRGMRESELAAEIVFRLEQRRIFPSVLLVGADDRHMRFRHPSVDSAAVERSVLAVVVGVRGGLNVALTRTATLGTTPSELAERHRAACEVEAKMIAATTPGAAYGDALQRGIEAYEALGFPEEWRHHYQGGPIGYGPREFNIAPLEKPNEFTGYAVAEHHACAWNPTVQGTKSEDTFLVGPGGAELVSNSESWPSIEVQTPGGSMRRPGILELGDGEGGGS